LLLCVEWRGEDAQPMMFKRFESSDGAFEENHFAT